MIYPRCVNNTCMTRRTLKKKKGRRSIIIHVATLKASKYVGVIENFNKHVDKLVNDPCL